MSKAKKMEFYPQRDRFNTGIADVLRMLLRSISEDRQWIELGWSQLSSVHSHAPDVALLSSHGCC